jgi:hypothetical protein
MPVTIAIERETSPAFFRSDLASRRLIATYGLLYSFGAVRWLAAVPAPAGVLKQVNGLAPHYSAVGTGLIFTAFSLYSSHRRFPSFATGLLSAIAFLCVSEAFCLPAQFTIFYFGREFALIDQFLAQVDQLAFFDWVSYYQYVCNNSTIFHVMQFCYDSVWWQPIFISLTLIYFHRNLELCVLYCTVAFSYVAACLIALAFPCLDAHHFYAAAVPIKVAFVPHFAGETIAQAVLWARAFPAHPNVVLQDPRIITFPSFHAAMATAFVLSAWRLPILRWPLLLIDAVLFLAIPPMGSHFLFDVVVGTAIALMCWFGMRRFLNAIGGPGGDLAVGHSLSGP